MAFKLLDVLFLLLLLLFLMDCKSEANFVQNLSQGKYLERYVAPASMQNEIHSQPVQHIVLPKKDKTLPSLKGYQSEFLTGNRNQRMHSSRIPLNNAYEALPQTMYLFKGIEGRQNVESEGYSPGGYGSAPPGSYGSASPGGYGSAPSRGHGSAPPSEYGSAPTGGYGSAPPGGYGSAPPGGYGSAPPRGYGSAPPGGYGSAPPGGYGSAPPGGYGSAPPGGYGSAPPGGYGAQIPSGVGMVFTGGFQIPGGPSISFGGSPPLFDP